MRDAPADSVDELRESFTILTSYSLDISLEDQKILCLDENIELL
jgi:hypothetical protein